MTVPHTSSAPHLKLALRDRSRQNVWMKVNCQFTCEYVWISATWWADSLASLHTCDGTAQRLRVLAGGRASASTGVIFPLTLHPASLFSSSQLSAASQQSVNNTLLYSVIKGLVYPTLRPGSHQTHMPTFDIFIAFRPIKFTVIGLVHFYVLNYLFIFSYFIFSNHFHTYFIYK